MPGFFLNFFGDKTSLERDSKLQGPGGGRLLLLKRDEGELRAEMVGCRERHVISVGWWKMWSAQPATG